MTEHSDTKIMATKAGVAWSGTALSYYLESIGIKDWGDVAAFLAAIYSLLLICEWVYKRFFKRQVP